MQEGFDAAKLRAAYLVQASGESVAGEFWSRMARDLLAVALYTSADEQGIDVPDVDLPGLLVQLTESDVHAWLAEPAALLGLSSLAGILAVPNSARGTVVQSACAVLAAQRPVPETDVDDD